MLKGQVWIETVIYTLIGLTLIGVVLTLALPKINSYRDRVIVEQSIDSMNTFDSKIREVIDSSQGNVRKIDFFSIKKGKIVFNSSGDEISFVIDDLSRPYSEPGEVVSVGATKVVTEKLTKGARVSISLDYSQVADLKFEGDDIKIRELAESSTPYAFSIENKGVVSGNKIEIDLKETSGK